MTVLLAILSHSWEEDFLFLFGPNLGWVLGVGCGDGVEPVGASRARGSEMVISGRRVAFDKLGQARYFAWVINLSFILASMVAFSALISSCKGTF